MEDLLDQADGLRIGENILAKQFLDRQACFLVALDVIPVVRDLLGSSLQVVLDVRPVGTITVLLPNDHAFGIPLVELLACCSPTALVAARTDRKDFGTIRSMKGVIEVWPVFTTIVRASLPELQDAVSAAFIFHVETRYV